MQMEDLQLIYPIKKMIDLTQQLQNDLGEPSTYRKTVKVKKEVDGEMKEVNQGEETPVTLFRLLKHALLEDPGSIPLQEVKDRYNIFMKIRGVDEVEFSKKEIELLLKCVIATLDIVAAGQIIKILE